MSETTRSDSLLVALPAALGGALVGVVGALLWHFSLTPPGPSNEVIALDGGARFVQPPLSWWPASAVIAAAAAAWFGLGAYALQGRMRSRANRPSWWVTAAAAAGGLFGLGLAAVGRWFPPQLPAPFVVPGDPSLTALESARAGSAESAPDLPTRIPLGEPLLMFPVITALVAVVTAVGVTLVRRQIASPGLDAAD